jgi:hypothetical protein
MPRHLITALLLALLFSCNPLISSEIISSAADLGDSSFLPMILSGFGFEFAHYQDGLRLLIFALIFIFLMQVIACKKFSVKVAILLIAILLVYIFFVFSNERFSISYLLAFLLIGIVASSVDRKNSVIFLIFGMLIKFWLSLLLMALLLCLFNGHSRNRILIHRLVLVLIDSILLFAPLFLVLNYLRH